MRTRRIRRTPQPPEPELADDVLAAFIRDDIAAIREALGLPVWNNTPLHTFPDGTCDYCHQPVDGAPGTNTAGCVNNHEAWALRGRIIAEIERRGRFVWADLDAEDDDVAEGAWNALASVAERVGVSEAEWERFLEETFDEQEANDDRA